MVLDHKQSALLSLALVGVVDSISYMVVTPSLIFYIEQVHGTKEQYGFILSAFSLASFCAKPLLGSWVDVSGNQFRMPYLTSIVTATIGGFLYFYASAFKEQTMVAIGLIAAGRILGGVGAANNALGFAYLASVIPPEEQTKTNSLLSMTRIIGMAAGPGFNVLLKDIDTTITIGSKTIHVDSLNSVGLFLVATNMLGFLFIFFLLKEPGRKLRKKHSSRNSDGDVVEEDYTEDEISTWAFIKALFSIEILLPIFTIFVFNSNFQVIETGFAPAAKHALGWGPVATSTVLGSTSLMLFGCMLVTFYLSAKGTRDEILVMVGSSSWIIGGGLLYTMWVADTEVWKFVLPVFVCICGFPFIAASNRSLFTRRVDVKPALEVRHAFMQALLSMFASVAGFVTPSFVAAYVLRSGEEVDASDNHRELSPLALYIVVGPILTILGVIYVTMFKPLEVEVFGTDDDIFGDGDEETADETTNLVPKRDSGARVRRASKVILEQKVDQFTEANRRMSTQCMGIPCFEPSVEDRRRSSVFAQLAACVAQDHLEEGGGNRMSLIRN